MSSFENIEKAIAYEAQRHIDAIEFDLEELVQETRRFDEASGKTFAMRDKETEADYRYFPDPNLMPIIIDDEWIAKIMAEKPVAVDEKMEYYREAGISEKEISVLVSGPKASAMLDGVVELGCNPKDAAAWILTDCAGILRKIGKTIEDIEFSAKDLAAIMKMVAEGTINRNAGKSCLIALIEDGKDPVAFCKENGFDKKIDAAEIANVVDKVLAENQQSVDSYKSGKVKAFQALFGACMRELKGAGDHAVIKELLEKRLNG